MQAARHKQIAIVLAVTAVAVLAGWLSIAVPLLRRYPNPPAQPAWQRLPKDGHLLLAVLGDAKNNTPPLEAILRDARHKKADGAIILGDFVTRGSTLSLAYVTSRIEAAAKAMPWMAAIGNHEKGFYGDARLFTEFFGPPNYWWRFGRMLFVVIDDVNEDDYQNQLDWLSRTLREQEKPGDQVYLFLHRPPKVEGHLHSLNTEDTKALAEALKGHNLAATFTSHRHGHEELVFAGAPLYVTGQAGAEQEIDPPVYGYVLLDCSPERCETIHVVVQAKSASALRILLNLILFDYPFTFPLVALALAATAVVGFIRARRTASLL